MITYTPGPAGSDEEEERQQIQTESNKDQIVGWWSGRYGEVTGDEVGVGFRHGIVVTGCSRRSVARPSHCLVLVTPPMNRSAGYGSMKGTHE